ncbi:MAG: DUF4350 domain-containing protein [Candidatus Dormibacteria bacterium]
MPRFLVAASLAAMACVGMATTALAQTGDAESDDPNGTSALRQLADARGHHSVLLRDTFRPPGKSGVLFVLGPEIPFRPSESDELVNWVRGGGVLVYAATLPNQGLEGALGIARVESSPVFDPAAEAVAGTPVLAGVTTVRTGPTSAFKPPSGSQVVLLRSTPDERIVGIQGSLGGGRYFALASTTLLDNETIGLDGNWRLAGDLLAAAGPAAPVLFDQYHHAGGAGEGSSLGWLLTPWGLSILLEVVLVFALLALGGRAFGPRVPLQPAVDPASSEFTTAVGAMLRRAGARRQTIDRLVLATRAAVAAQTGLRQAADAGQVERALRQRWPALADALQRAVGRAGTVEDERSLAVAAEALHRLAHPALGPAPAITDQPTRRNS